MKHLFFLLFSFTIIIASAQCTDPAANNYDAAATYNDGSCTYNATNYSITPRVANLPNILNEISGMIYYNGKIYGHQDSGGPNKLYEINPANGALTKTITLSGTTNVDWEDMTQDDTHIYIGDTGNNSNGNRTNLRIYKFPKSAITAGANITISAANIDVINYSYEDQTNFTATGGNNTEFDCEAIAFNRGKLHLFTKNWIGSTTAHYVLPIEAGTYSASKKETFNTGSFKITGASVGAFDSLILISYRVTGLFRDCALFLDYGFDGTYYYFNTGAKRRLDIGSAANLGQVEGICFIDALHGYISNEATSGFFGKPQRFYRFSIRSFIKDYYEHNRVNYDSSIPLTEAGTLKFNGESKSLQGYDGNHWLPLNNNF